MDFNEVYLIGIGLSMDAVAVSMSCAMVHYKSVPKLVEMVCLFAVFQGLMPVLGFFAGGVFLGAASRFGRFLVFLIFAIIGGKMIYSGLCQGDDCPLPPALTHKLLLLQAVATSIDALVVGVCLRVQQINIIWAGVIIAVITLVLTFAAMLLGRRFGDLFGKKAEVLGGLLLLVTGIKSVI